MKSVLITGGSGAFGNAFARHLLSMADSPPARIVIFSRGEFRQFQMAQELKSSDKYERLRYFIGDVRDRDRLKRAMQDIEVVVHAAALKRIEVGNYNPIEMVKTNVDGAVNVIEAAQDAGVKKVVALSSDKAYRPVSPYGTSKAMAESLFLAANNTTGEKGPRFAVTRYGNVWGSTGSVVPVWRSMIANGGTIPITDPKCTRFFMLMQEAVHLVLDTINNMKGGEVNIPNLPAYCLADLATAMRPKKIIITGLPVWEKLHESMSADNHSYLARRMSIPELERELDCLPVSG